MRKTFYLGVIFLFFQSFLYSQLVIEPFDYAGNNLTNAPGTIWTLHSGSTPIEVLATPSDSGNSLAFNNFPASLGNRIKLTFANNADAGVNFSPQLTSDGTDLYASFLLKLTDLPFTNYFAHFFIGTNGLFRSTTWTRLNGNNYQLGIGVIGNNPVFAPNLLATNTTHLVVIKYSRVAGPDNDGVSLYIDPVPGQPEPAPSATQTLPALDITPEGVARFGLRQSTGIGEIELDELRIGTSWTEVFSNGLQGTNTVTIANTSDSSELGTNGVFTLTSTGSNYPITVTYSLSGTATISNDFAIAAPATTNTVIMTNSSQTITILPIQDNDTNEVDPETIVITLDPSGSGWVSGDPSSATNLLYQGAIPVPSAVLGYSLELKKPKPGTLLKFSSLKGFKTKGRVKTTNTVSEVSYTVLVNTNTNSNFVIAGKFKSLVKGKLFKKGYRATYRSTKTSRAGVGTSAGTTSIQLVTKVVGSAGEAYFTNVFPSLVK